jgi:hypothetical protein
MTVGQIYISKIIFTVFPYQLVIFAIIIQNIYKKFVTKKCDI